MLLGAAVMLVISRNYAYMMQGYPEAGGAYTYAKEVFGHDHGFLTAWFLALTYLAMLWANATSLPLFARYFLGGIFRFGRLYALFNYDVYLGEALLSQLILGLTALLLMRRGRLVARLMVVLAGAFALGITAVFLGAMAKESYFLFIVWSILGFLFFRGILRRDKDRRFGKSVIVWMVLLALVLFIALIWMRQSMISSNRLMMDNIRVHYRAAEELSEARVADEQFITAQMAELERANTRTMLMATGMFIFALIIMLSNYSFMNKQNQETEKLANTDAMTGVKNKHACLTAEQDINDTIQRGKGGEFAIVVCDVNGLKYINDNYGHKAGDDYIRAASAMICELFQHSPVYRTGGDEFVAILRGRDYENRAAIMAELHRLSESRIGTDQVVVSAGMSEYAGGADADCHAVFARADSLMYQNKQALKSMGARTR